MPPAQKETAQSFSTSDCVTFDTFSDASYPGHLISESSSRLLNYETLQGVAEIVSWIVKSAGAEATFQLTDKPTKSKIDRIANEIDESCISNSHPSTFPLQSPAYVKRMIPLLSSVAKSLEESESNDVLEYLCNIVAALTSTHLQSLRHCATAFGGVILSAISDEMGTALVRASSTRCTDVSIAIRKRAIAMSGSRKPEVSVKALNDDNASVRLAALRALGNSDHGSERISEMAVHDVDQSVRRACLRMLISHEDKLNDDLESWGNLKAMAYDEDLLSRRLSAELEVSHAKKLNGTSTDDEASAASSLVKVCDLVTDESEATQAVAYGLEKQRSSISTTWPQEIVRSLTTDFTKQARKRTRSATSKAKEMRLLANELGDKSHQMKSSMLLCASLQMEVQGSQDVVSQVPTLLRRMQVDTDLLAYSLVATSHLPFRPIMLASSDDERLLNDVIDIVRELFENRSEPKILESISLIFQALPESLNEPSCSDLYHDHRLALASLLGPKGQNFTKNADEIETLASKLMILGRHVDMSDIVNSPIWVALNGSRRNVNGSEVSRQLVCSLAMRGDAPTMQKVVQKLSEKKPAPDVDDILKIFVSAKMREVDIDMALPVDVNEAEPSSESVWRAAVAAGVI